MALSSNVILIGHNGHRGFLMTSVALKHQAHSRHTGLIYICDTDVYVLCVNIHVCASPDLFFICGSHRKLHGPRIVCVLIQTGIVCVGQLEASTFKYAHKRNLNVH